MIVVDGAAKRATKRAALELTARQLFIGMHLSGFISAEEAIAAATVGAMPAAVEAIVAALPEADQVVARITWARMTRVRRADPLVDLLAAAAGQSGDAIDTFFETYSHI